MTSTNNTITLPDTLKSYYYFTIFVSASDKFELTIPELRRNPLTTSMNGTAYYTFISFDSVEINSKMKTNQILAFMETALSKGFTHTTIPQDSNTLTFEGVSGDRYVDVEIYGYTY